MGNDENKEDKKIDVHSAFHTQKATKMSLILEEEVKEEIDEIFGFAIFNLDRNAQKYGDERIRHVLGGKLEEEEDKKRQRKEAEQLFYDQSIKK